MRKPEKAVAPKGAGKMLIIEITVGPHRTRLRHAALAGVAASVLIALSSGADAQQKFRIGEVDFVFNGAASFGSSIRTERQHSTLIPRIDGAQVGVPGIMAGGKNQDDGNLNFNRGKAVSTVLKTMLSLDARYQNVGFYVSGYAWTDLTLSNVNVPWGHSVNGYAANRPLSDSPFNNYATFSGISLMDAYLYGKTELAGIGLNAKLGNQLVPWGIASTVSGGLRSALNGIDLNAVYRPGATPDEMGVRTPTLLFGADLTKQLNVQAFYRLQSSHTQYPGCGTFYSTADYVAPGCNMVDVLPGSSGSSRTAYLLGYHSYRRPDIKHHTPQFGIGGTYQLEKFNTTLGLYYAHVDSTAISINTIRSKIAGVPFIPSQPGAPNLNGTGYAMEYTDNVNVFAGNFTTKFSTGTTVYGEYTYRARQALNQNAIDLLNGFASNTAPSLLRSVVATVPLGGTYKGYDRYNMGNLQLGVNQIVPQVAGAAALILNGDVVLKQVYALPDVMLRRYGRSDVYGAGPINGTCAAGTTTGSLECSNRGYVTANAWGYKLRAALRYTDLFIPGLDVTPSFGITHDVSGWSSDLVLNKGRIILNPGLRIDYKKNYYADIGWNPQVRSSKYDNSRDRQVVTVSTGMKF